MALPIPPSAADLVAFLNRNDQNYPELSIVWPAELIETWTNEELCEIAQAAQQNTSIHKLKIDVVRAMTDAVADIVPTMIVSRLHHVQEFHIIADSVQIMTPFQSLRCSPRVDKLLLGLRHSTILSETLRRVHFTVLPGDRTAMLEFFKRFPHIQSFGLENGCYVNQEMALSVAATYTTLSESLKTVILDCTGEHRDIARVLSALHSLTNMKILHLDLFHNDDSRELLAEAGILAVSHPSLESLLFYGSESEYPDVSSFLQFTEHLPMKASKLAFVDCDVPVNARMPQGLDSLRLTNSTFNPPADGNRTLCALLERDLPDLKQLIVDVTCEDFEFSSHEDVSTSGLETNEELERLTTAIANHKKIDDVALELVSTETNPSIPAIQSLLKKCKGELRLKCRNLMWVDTFHFVRGLETLNPDLRRLSLLFRDCALGDAEYASLLQPLRTIGSLKSLEIGFDRRAELEDLEQTRAAVRDLVRSNTSLQELRLLWLESEASQLVLEQCISDLVHNTSLVHLHVEPTKEAGPLVIPPNVVNALVQVLLQTNAVFHTLSGATFDSPEADFLLKLNRNGRRFLLDPNLAPLGVWQWVLSRALMNSNAETNPSNGDVVYHCLRTRPNLLVRDEKRREIRRSRPNDDDNEEEEEEE